MTQPTPKPAGDEPAGDETGAAADDPSARPEEQAGDPGDDRRNPDRYQPL
jgi:hypothetical protein